MSLLDTIFSLSTDGGYYVRRYATAAFVDGVAQPPVLLSRFQITAVLQPATGMQRVVPGFDMHGVEDGQYVVDVREFYTDTELRTRRPANEPDVFEYDGSDWIVDRVEPWDLAGDKFYRCTVTRLNRGAS